MTPTKRCEKCGKTMEESDVSRLSNGEELAWCGACCVAAYDEAATSPLKTFEVPVRRKPLSERLAALLEMEGDTYRGAMYTAAKFHDALRPLVQEAKELEQELRDARACDAIERDW